MTKGAEKVTVSFLAEVDDQDEFDPKAWPSGSVFAKAFATTNITPPVEDNVEKYYQSCARHALLHKYGYLKPGDLQHANEAAFFDAVEKVWLDALQDGNAKNDLVEMLQSGGKSNKRNMKFSIINCGPGVQFKLHAHPNLELIYSLKGTLHEIRMDGPPVGKEYDPHPTDQEKVVGPDFSNTSKAWKFGTLTTGEYLVNECGSVHKSFTATNGEGAVLLTLWSGSHADIIHEPKDPSVQKAVDTMDEKLSSCSCTTDWHSISQTFLPESEKLKS